MTSQPAQAVPPSHPSPHDDVVELRATKDATSLAVQLTLDTALEHQRDLEADGWTVAITAAGDEPQRAAEEVPRTGATWLDRRRERRKSDARRALQIRAVRDHVHRTWELSEANRRNLDRLRRWIGGFAGTD